MQENSLNGTHKKRMLWTGRTVPKELQNCRKGDSNLPRHIAIIMDGNGRWAKKRLLPRIEGHRAGAKAVRVVVEEARRVGVRYLTLFSFSTENWLRPKDEVSTLMGLFCQYLESETPLLLKHEIRLRAMGELNKLPSQVQELLTDVERKTENLSGMDLILALSYGGRDELVCAMQKIGAKVSRGEIEPSSINQETIASHLYLREVPYPDLLIRTSDECRISNFLLWQLAYSEIVVSPQLWPDFNKEEFHRCLSEFAQRRRRFGLTDEQIEGFITSE